MVVKSLLSELFMLYHFVIKFAILSHIIRNVNVLDVYMNVSYICFNILRGLLWFITSPSPEIHDFSSYVMINNQSATQYVRKVDELYSYRGVSGVYSFCTSSSSRLETLFTSSSHTFRERVCSPQFISEIFQNTYTHILEIDWSKWNTTNTYAKLVRNYNIFRFCCLWKLETLFISIFLRTPSIWITQFWLQRIEICWFIFIPSSKKP